jgi:hypothetical protein
MTSARSRKLLGPQGCHHHLGLHPRPPPRPPQCPQANRRPLTRPERASLEWLLGRYENWGRDRSAEPRFALAAFSLWIVPLHAAAHGRRERARRAPQLVDVIGLDPQYRARPTSPHGSRSTPRSEHGHRRVVVSRVCRGTRSRPPPGGRSGAARSARIRCSPRLAERHHRDLPGIGSGLGGGLWIRASSGTRRLGVGVEAGCGVSLHGEDLRMKRSNKALQRTIALPRFARAGARR